MEEVEDDGGGTLKMTADEVEDDNTKPSHLDSPKPRHPRPRSGIQCERQRMPLAPDVRRPTSPRYIV